MNGLLTAAIIGIAALATVLAGRWFNKQNFLFQRERLRIADALAQDPTSAGIEPSVYYEVVKQLDFAFNLDEEKLRPNDRLEDIFALDSWELGQGQEQFEAWLIKRAGRQAGFKSAVTIADVVRVVQAAGNEPVQQSGHEPRPS